MACMAWPAWAGCGRAELFSQPGTDSFARPRSPPTHPLGPDDAADALEGAAVDALLSRLRLDPNLGCVQRVPGQDPGGA